MQDFVHGVLIDEDGAATHYAVHKRTRKSGGFIFERLVPAAFVDQHGVLRALRPDPRRLPIGGRGQQLPRRLREHRLRAGEVQGRAAVRAGVLRQNSDALGEVGTDTTTNAETGETDTTYNVDFGSGPVQLDLDPGDKAKFLSTQNPSSQFQDFTRLVLMIALKALDIPYVLFDESHANYNGSRQAILQYQLSADKARRQPRAAQPRHGLALEPVRAGRRCSSCRPACASATSAGCGSAATCRGSTSSRKSPQT
jgi:hypothetical protein